MQDPVERLVAQLELEPHPEGGFYRETFRSSHRVQRLDGPPGSNLSAGTSIYYLLARGAHSAWHRIGSDEIWHYHAGHALDIYSLNAGKLQVWRLGNPLQVPGSQFQVCIAAGSWFAARLVDPENFVLAGCTVSPGFEFAEFELATVEALVAEYPWHAGLIRELALARP